MAGRARGKFGSSAGLGRYSAASGGRIIESRAEGLPSGLSSIHSLSANRPIAGERDLRTACKPGSVPHAFARMDGHSSGTAVTRGLLRSTREAGRRRPWAEPLLPLYDLAPGGACHAAFVAGGAVGS